MHDQPTELTREDLYDLVWSEPMSTVAPRLGISDRALGKICQRLKVPRPGVGYWQRKAAGKRDRRPPLRSLPAGANERDFRWRPKRNPEILGPVEEQRRFESSAANKIEVPQRVGRYHPLVQQTRAALEDAGESDGGGQGTRRLNVDVSKKSRPRALRVMNTLIKALEIREMPVTIDASTGRTVVDVRGISIGIQLEERYEQVEVRSGPWPRRRRRGTGRLALKIDGWNRDLRQTWADGKRQRVERCLNSFVVGLVTFAEGEREWERKRMEREREERERRRQIEDEKRRKALERKRVTEIRQQAANWQEADLLRAYVAVVRSALARPDGSLDEAAAAWLEWAEGYIERLDPLTDSSAIPAKWREDPPAELPPQKRRWNYS